MMNDITGQRFGYLTVLRAMDERQCGHVIWECQCDCGKLVYLRRGRLTSGRTTSCGCVNFGTKKIRDISGQRFGRLIAIRPTEKRQSGSVIWICKCDCGNIIEVCSGRLHSGNTKTCGCSWKERGKDFTGMRFGRLVAVKATEKRDGKYVVWECLCDCGNAVFVRTGSLTNGNTKSCGCLKRER